MRKSEVLVFVVTYENTLILNIHHNQYNWYHSSLIPFLHEIVSLILPINYTTQPNQTNVYFFDVISMRPLKHTSITEVSNHHSSLRHLLCSLSCNPALRELISQRRKSAASFRSFTVYRSLLLRITSLTNYNRIQIHRLTS